MANAFYTENYNNANVKAFLTLIRYTEGTSGANGYRTMFTGRLFSDMSRHPNINNCSGSLCSTAAGAYQFLYKTWVGIIRATGVTDFSPASQDIGGIYLINIRKALGLIKEGKFYSAVHLCSWEWASFPVIKDVVYKGTLRRAGSSVYGQPAKNINVMAEYYKKNGGTITEDPNNLSIGGAARLPDGGSSGSSGGANNVSGGDNYSTPSLTAQGASGDRIEIIFDPMISPRDIEIELPSNAHAQEYANNVGYLPFVYYNAYPLEADDIQYMKMYNDGVVPSVNIVFYDSGGLMGDGGFPIDDTKISIFLNSKSKKIKGIMIDYKITKITKKSEGIYLVKASLDVTDLYSQTFKTYGTGTSMAVLQEVCREIGLGFKTNMADTTDTNTWSATGESTIDFINEIVDGAYGGDNTFIVGYIDYHYYFTLVDIEKELNREVLDEEQSSELGLGQFLAGSTLIDENDNNKVFLTNDQSMLSSNVYFESYFLTNSATEKSLNDGQSDVVSYYDTNKKQIVEFQINGNTTDGNIQLKGAPNDNNAIKKNQKVQYIGRVDTDVQNVNTLYSAVQNERNISDLTKITMVVDMSIPNYTLSMCQKLPVIISTNSPTPSKNSINFRLSGEYIISDITYDYDGYGVLTQHIELLRRDLSLSPSEKNDTQNQAETDTKNQSDKWNGNSTNVVPEDLRKQENAARNNTVQTGRLAKAVGNDSKNIDNKTISEIDTFSYIKNKYQIFSTRMGVINPIANMTTISDMWITTPKEWKITNSIETGDICYINVTSLALVTDVADGVIHGVVVKNKKISKIKLTAKTFLRIPY